MASCCSTFGDEADEYFTQQMAARDLARYRRKGPGSTTRLMVEGITAAGGSSGLLLDVGSGVGSLTFELLESGVTQAEALRRRSTSMDHIQVRLRLTRSNPDRRTTCSIAAAECTNVRNGLRLRRRCAFSMPIAMRASHMSRG